MSAPTIHPERYQGHDLVFIVGSPRSGTTWLQRILAAHPVVQTGQESNLFMYIGPLLSRWREELSFESSRGGVGLGCYLTEEAFLRTVQEFLLELLEPFRQGLAEGELFLEKTPSHALYIPEIVELLPQARFIHIVRDPKDVVASLLAASRSWGAHWAPRDPQEAARVWARHVRKARRAAEKLPASQFLEVKYEDLLRDTAGQVERCSSFLGLRWTPESLEKALTENDASKARKGGGGTPIPLGGELAKQRGKQVVTEPEGFIRTGKAGGWQRDLRLSDLYWIWRICRTEANHYGYSWPSLFQGAEITAQAFRKIKGRAGGFVADM